MNLRRLLFVIALLASIAMGLPLAAGAAGPVQLNYSCFFPPTHVQSKLAQAWCQEVEKRTKGAVRIQYFPGQTLTKAQQVYDGVVNGLSDLGFSLFAYTRGRFPVMEVVDLPLGYPSGMVATKVANAVFENFRPKELSQVAVMYLHAHGPGLLHTREKPVMTMADLKGLKIRSTGFSAKVVSALGGTPVAMPMPATYQALQRGVVDGSLYPLESNKGWKLAEVVKNVTLNHSMAYTTCFYVVMNKAKWNSLSPDTQKIIAQINREWSAKHGLAWDESDRAGLAALRAKGGKIIKLAPAEAERWRKTTGKVLLSYVKDAANKGLPGGNILEYAQMKLAELSK